jgi:hypothetical protein
LAVSAIACLLCNVLYDGYDLQSRLGVDDDVCWLALLAGPLFMSLVHRRYHTSRWLPWLCTALGIAGLATAATLFETSGAAAREHVPTGPFSGIEYVVLQLASILGGAVSLAAAFGGLLGVVARRLDKTLTAAPRHI